MFPSFKKQSLELTHDNGTLSEDQTHYIKKEPAELVFLIITPSIYIYIY